MTGKLFRVISMVAWLVGFWGAAVASGQSCLEFGHYMHPTWVMDTSSNNQTKGGCFSGDYLLLAEGWEGLRIVRLTDHSQPEIVGNLDLSGFCRDVAVAGNVAYVVTGGGGWYIIDISDPSLPVLLETRDEGADGATAKTFGNLLFLLFDGWGAIIHDLSDPANPVYVGGLFNSNPVDIAVDGQLAFLATYSFMYIFDITNPAMPVELGSAGTVGMGAGIVSSGSLVFMAVDYQGVQVFDVSDPDYPTTLSIASTLENASDVAVLGDQVFVTLQYTGVQAFDASDPAHLSPLWFMDTRGSSERVLLEGDQLCIFEAFGGFNILDVSLPVAEPVSRQFTPGPVLGVALDGGYCFVVEGELGLQVFDVSNPANPHSIAYFDNQQTYVRVLVEDGVAYLAEEWGGIQLFDVSNQVVPTPLGSFSSDNPRDMVLRDELLFLADYSNGLVIWDVSDSTSPQLVGSGDTPDWAYGVDVAGDFAYVADNSSGLQVLDVSIPSNPMTVGFVDLVDFAMDVEVVGHLAFVPNYRRGLAIVDVTLPEAPVQIQRVDLPNFAVGIKISGSVAYVACEGGGVVLVDIADPDHAYPIGCLPSLGSTDDLALSDTHLFIADGEGGLAVIAKQCVEPSPVLNSVSLPAIPRLNSVYPNPFNPRTTISFTQVGTGPVSLRIFDLAGRLVRVLEEGVLDARTHQVVWDGRDTEGRLVASAPYVVRLQAGDVVEKQKVLLVR